MVKSAVGNRFGFLFVVGVGLAGCAPLQQAPLVYSSKTIVGVDISSPTSEQPGVSLSLGFKNLDAAYVPVAVAKPCKEPEGSSEAPNHDINYKQIDCENAIYGMQLVGGKVDGINENHKNEGKQSKQLDELMVLLGKRDVLNSEIQLLSTSADAGDQNKVTNDKSQLVDIEKKLASITSSNPEILVEAMEKNNKGDSYSVFGSFDSKTKAKTDAEGKSAEAGVTLGKVFSTGIAAQYLSDGLGRQHASLGEAEKEKACLAEGRKMLSDYQAAAKDKFDAAVYADLAKTLATSCSSALPK